MSYKNLQLETSDKVSVLTINRPQALNALNNEVLDELESCAKDMGQSKNHSVLIITGAGKSFVAGADIKSMSDLSPEEAQSFAEKGQRVFSLIESLPFPVIAAVNGFALGGGLELALSCDVLYMSEKAKLGLPEVTLGLLPAFGGTQRLVRAVGLYKAKEMIFSGNIYSAKDVFSMGLGNKMTSPSELMDAVLALASDIKQRGPLGIEKSKELIHAQDDLTLKDRLQMEAEGFKYLFTSKDSREGMKAFIEKRPPEFKGL